MDRQWNFHRLDLDHDQYTHTTIRCTQHFSCVLCAEMETCFPIRENRQEEYPVCSLHAHDDYLAPFACFTALL